MHTGTTWKEIEGVVVPKCAKVKTPCFLCISFPDFHVIFLGSARECFLWHDFWAIGSQRKHPSILSIPFWVMLMLPCAALCCLWSAGGLASSTCVGQGGGHKCGMFRTHWDVGAEHTWSICRRCAEPFHRWARQLFCVILSSKSGGVCGWLIEVGILDAHGVCCFSVIKPGKIWCLLLCCYCCSECTPGMFLWNVPQSKFSDCRLDIRRTSGESLQQHIKKQTTGGWCHLLKAVICKNTCDMFYICSFCSLTNQVWCFAERTGQQASLDTKGHGKGTAPPLHDCKDSDSW